MCWRGKKNLSGKYVPFFFRVPNILKSLFGTKRVILHLGRERRCLYVRAVDELSPRVSHPRFDRRSRSGPLKSLYVLEPVVGAGQRSLWDLPSTYLGRSTKTTYGFKLLLRVFYRVWSSTSSRWNNHLKFSGFLPPLIIVLMYVPQGIVTRGEDRRGETSKEVDAPVVRVVSVGKTVVFPLDRRPLQLWNFSYRLSLVRINFLLKDYDPEPRRHYIEI